MRMLRRVPLRLGAGLARRGELDILMPETDVK